MLDNFAEIAGINKGLFRELINKQNGDGRYYHCASHPLNLIKKIYGANLGSITKDLIITALMHDYIYDPLSSTNEQDSALAYLDLEKDARIRADNSVLVYQAIIDTINHNPTNDFSRIFCEFDLSIFNDPFADVLAFEQGIRKEYAFADWAVYREKRTEILRNFVHHDLIRDNSKAVTQINALRQIINNDTPKIAVYAGSFKPMHTGHLNIYQKAEQIFDKVILAYGDNTEKAKEEHKVPEYFKYKQVDKYTGSLIDYIDSKKYPVTIIRGLRNTTDMQAELNFYRWLQERNSDVKVVSIFCDKEYEHISSSAIRAAKNLPDYREIIEGMLVR